MGYYVHQSVIDAALNEIATADEMHLCSQQPLTYADVATYSLANAPMTPDEFSIENAANGRRALVVGQWQATATAAGDITHTVLVDTAGSRLLYVTPGVGTIAATGLMDVQEWRIYLTPPAGV